MSPLQRRRALIVDDNALIVMMLRRALTKAGYEVVGVAKSGEGAIAEARRLLPDLLLMDIGLQGMNGIEATKRIFAERSVPIILLSGHDPSTFPHVEGACGYLVKPISAQGLTDALKSCFDAYDASIPVTLNNGD